MKEEICSETQLNFPSENSQAHADLALKYINSDFHEHCPFELLPTLENGSYGIFWSSLDITSISHSETLLSQTHSNPISSDED